MVFLSVGPFRARELGWNSHYLLKSPCLRGEGLQRRKTPHKAPAPAWDQAGLSQSWRSSAQLLAGRAPLLPSRPAALGLCILLVHPDVVVLSEKEA